MLSDIPEKLGICRDELEKSDRQLVVGKELYEQTIGHATDAIPILEEVTALTQVIQGLLEANRAAAIELQNNLAEAGRHLAAANLVSNSPMAKSLGAFLSAAMYHGDQVVEQTSLAQNTGEPMDSAPEFYARGVEYIKDFLDVLGEAQTVYDTALTCNQASTTAGQQFLAP